MTLYIVIPVHNRKNFTRECLLSLGKQTFSNFSIIVVDDGSTDGTAEMLEIEFPNIHMLHGDGSLFWTASINLGIRFALNKGANYIMTLNNDTLAPPDFVERMVYWAHEKQNALIGALDIDYSTKQPNYGGEIINWILDTSRPLLKELPLDQHMGLHEVSFFPGRGLLIPKAVFECVGLFEETKLPHYMSDYDFTLLASRAGFPIYCNYDAKLYTYPEEGGDRKLLRNKSLINYYNHLFGIKGAGNLRNFTIYTFRNCPKKYIPISLLIGYMRRLASYWVY